jgi:MYXO-CTERM domain-containing protein
MRRALLPAAILTLVSALAAAPAHAQHADPVIGGHAADAGKWPDAVAVMFGNQAECTGVLIAPTVALTAGHCADAGLTAVVVGAANLTQTQTGETINVTKQITYPAWESSIDITVLVLEHASTRPPRPIATGWARGDISNGAQVAIVGWGSTDANGNQYPDAQQEALTTITDFDCSTSAGCNAGAQPAGELGAGGMGIDTCPGDSGGPLYLVTSYGTFLAGTTSRSYDNAKTLCKDGGIYERPDKIVDWIEQQSGVKLPRGPEPSAEILHAQTGVASRTTVEPNDPKTGTSHTFAITAMPAHGGATVGNDGVVTYTSMPGYLGADELTVSVTDAAAPARTMSAKVTIDVTPKVEGGGCGCASGRPGAGALAPLFAVVFALRRRRGRARAR